MEGSIASINESEKGLAGSSETTSVFSYSWEDESEADEEPIIDNESPQQQQQQK